MREKNSYRHIQGDQTNKEHLMAECNHGLTKMKELLKGMIKLNRQRQVVTLAMVIVGIVLSCAAQLLRSLIRLINLDPV